jgi:hypothetical protein
MATSRKSGTKAAINSQIASATSKENSVRSKLSKRRHFVPINLGELDILRTTLGNFIKFNATPEDKALLKQQIEIAEKEYALQERRILGDVTLEEASPAKQREVEKTFNIVVGSILKKSVFDFESLKNSLIVFVKNKHKNTAIIDNNGLWTDTAGNPVIDITENGTIIDKLKTPCIVYDKSVSDKNILGVMYSSYDSAASGLFTPFFNKFVAKEFLKLDSAYKQAIAEQQKKSVEELKELGIDIGHLAGFSNAVRTVLQEKFTDAITIVRQRIETATEADRLILQEKIDQINDIDSQLRSASSYGRAVDDYLELNGYINSALNIAGALIVIPQERYENQYLYGSLIEAKFSRQLGEIMVFGTGSNSFAQDIGLKIVETIKYGTVKTILGKKPFQIKIKIPKVTKTKKKNTSGGVKLGTNPAKNISTVSVSNKQIKKPALNLTHLQNLINQSLVERVKQNMGPGNRRDVLNLRSGRFAESVKVERMSQSREGMITAFYSYMKNPYTTFSQGGRQENPKSRDPKLLIAKSIREIATAQVANRLRSVSV